jgi:hypothetical protein
LFLVVVEVETIIMGPPAVVPEVEQKVKVVVRQPMMEGVELNLLVEPIHIHQIIMDPHFKEEPL